MKILMIHPHDIYSNEEPWTVRITYIAEELVKKGHEVKIIYHPLSKNISMEKARKQQGFPFETIPMSRFEGILSKIKPVSAYVWWADIVHFQKCFAYVSIPAIYSAYRLKKPIHYDWDDWEYGIYNYEPMISAVGNFINLLEKNIPKLVDTISVASNELKKMCLSIGIEKYRIVDAPVGGNIERFNPANSGEEVRKEYHLGDKKMVMYLGQLHGAQYAELFIRAVNELLKRRDDIIFFVVGGGYNLEKLYKLAKKLNIIHKIVFTGAIDHKIVPNYVAAADICVACFEDTPQTRTKSPLKVVEYMSAGKAIVASAMGEVNNMLKDCGYLVKPGNYHEIANGVEYLLNNKDKADKLKTRSRKRAEDIYNWERTTENILKAYNIAIAMHKKKKALF